MIKTLDTETLKISNKIISPTAFYFQVGDALLNKKPLSTVRMGDGENLLYKDCLRAHLDDKQRTTVKSQTEEWRKKLGINGISYKELKKRIEIAANTCTHFAPSISGLVMPEYNLFNLFAERNVYIDNFFVNVWDFNQKANLYNCAQHVLFIHRNVYTADAIQNNLKKYLGVKVSFIKLDNWKETKTVIKRAQDSDAKLVLFSGGPAGKYMSPEIAQSNKVVLDIGNAADYWTFHNYVPK